MPRLPVDQATPLSPAEKLQMSLAMFDYGCDLMRENLRRRHPELDEAAVEERLRAWLRERPGAPNGDGEGRVRLMAQPTQRDLP